MSDASLSLEEVSPANQIGGHGMSKPVETDTVRANFISKFGEPVAESTGGKAPIMVQVPGDQPVTETPLAGRSSPPSRFTGPPPGSVQGDLVTATRYHRAGGSWPGSGSG